MHVDRTDAYTLALRYLRDTDHYVVTFPLVAYQDEDALPCVATYALPGRTKVARAALRHPDRQVRARFLIYATAVAKRDTLRHALATGSHIEL